MTRHVSGKIKTSEEMTVESLQAFAEAWNRHDVEDLMTFMTDDCVFEASAGPDVCGTRYLGKEEVKKAFSQVFVAIPDAQWMNPRHFVCGNRGVTEWTFTGTTTDGTTIQEDGCDVFTFREGKIGVKNSFRKKRQPKWS